MSEGYSPGIPGWHAKWCPQNAECNGYPCLTERKELSVSTSYEGPAIVEVFGHRRLAGVVTEVEVAGAKMIRVDVPSDPPATQFYGGSSIFCLTPCTEETMLEAVAAVRVPEPVHRWELPKPALPAGAKLSVVDELLRDYDIEEGRWHCERCDSYVDLEPGEERETVASHLSRCDG